MLTITRVVLTTVLCLMVPILGFPLNGEPSYKQAVARWPDMWRPIAFLGIKDHPDEFALMWNGNLSMTTRAMTDADRRLFKDRADDSLQVSFSVGEKPNFENRYVEDGSTEPSLATGYLPITRVRIRKRDVVLLQEAFASNDRGGGTAVWNAPVFLRVRFSVEQPGSGSSPIVLWSQLAKNHTRYAMRSRSNVRIARLAPLYTRDLRKKGKALLDSEGRVVLYSEQDFRFHPQLPEALNSVELKESQTDRNLCEFSLSRSQGAKLDLIFPFYPVREEKIGSVRQLNYPQARQSIVKFWKGEIGRGMQVEVPEEPVNNLWRFNVPLSFITADTYPNGDRVLKLSPHHYEAYWPTPNAMHLQELMQRGYLEEAAAYLKPFQDSERQRPVPNTGSSFHSTKGFISGPSEYLAISWISDHGAMLWAASEYFLLTRDQEFLDGWLPTMLEGLEWIAREREATKRRGGLGGGLMAAGRGTDDALQSNFVWSDAWVYRGLAAVCRVLKAIDHKELSRWENERNDYRATFQKIFRKLVLETARWTDPSGEQIPFVPYELRQTSPNVGKIDLFYIDTGPLFLGVAGLLEPNDEIITWAIKWLTEGPYSNSYSPEWSNWFDPASLPFEMSSGEPCYSWNIPVRFLRNEREKFLEGFYSLCAGSVSRRFLGGVEHRDGIQGVPATNAVINNHLRNMLIFEDEEDQGIHILRNSPSAWLGAGKQIRVEKAQTYFGPTSYTLSSHRTRIEVDIDPPARQPLQWIRLHLEHPEGKALRKVSVNGVSVSPLTSRLVEIKNPSGALNVIAEF